MLFRERDWAGLADGTITLTFRRWKRAQAKRGGLYRTPSTMLAVESVTVVEPGAISDDEARRAGWHHRDELLRELAQREGVVYRIAFHPAGPDPRIALRERDGLSDEEWGQLRNKLDRMDRRSVDGPWTHMVLTLIRDRPGDRAADLAASVGRERDPFKIDVRKLKALGLTESLEVGYRLSPRGRAFLARID